MAIIKQENLVGNDKKCSYVLAYFKKQNLKEGDEWNPLDYMKWIQSKQKEFNLMNGLPVGTTYWKGHNEHLMNQFLEFIM